MKKLMISLCLLVLATHLTACETIDRHLNGGYVSYPFKFGGPAKAWLKECEVSSPPSLQVIVDFDRLKRKYLKDKAYADSVE